MCEEGGGRRRRRRTGVQNQKQEPHTKMWGTNLPVIYYKGILSNKRFPAPIENLHTKTTRLLHDALGKLSTGRAQRLKATHHMVPLNIAWRCFATSAAAKRFTTGWVVIRPGRLTMVTQNVNEMNHQKHHKNRKGR